MSQFIDVLIAVDAESILEGTSRSQDPDRPTLVSDKHVHVVLKDPSGLSGSSKSKLTIQATLGDVVRVREVSVSYGFEHAVVSYRFKLEGHGIVPPVLVGGAQPDDTVMCASTSLPTQNNPIHPTRVDSPYHFWLTAVQAEEKCELKGRWEFIILNTDGSPEGYFYWCITIIVHEGAISSEPLPPSGRGARAIRRELIGKR